MTDRSNNLNRERGAGLDGFSQQPIEIKQDLSRLMFASARAGADIFVCMAQGFGSFLDNVKGNFLPSGFGYRNYDGRDRSASTRSPSRAMQRSVGDGVSDVRSAVRATAGGMAATRENSLRPDHRSVVRGRNPWS